MSSDVGGSERTHWADATTRCDCGADISQWHTGADLRRIRRHYQIGGTVPACPDCVSYRNHQEITSVVVAVRASGDESSIETDVTETDFSLIR